MSRPPSIEEVAKFLESWAPPASAQSYDNVGLQVGDPAAAVESAIIALDMTPAVLDEARSLGASLVITHHPLIFQPLRSITPHAFNANLALRLAESGIALYSIHTNLDAASGGVSFALAETLGVRDPEFLAVLDGDGDDGFDEISGDDSDDGRPIGRRAVGLGAIGHLPSPMPLESFLAGVAGRLRATSLRYAADPAATIERVAVCGGAGAEFVGAALRAGADAYVTSDIKYHNFFDVLDNTGRARLAFIDAGHYETEAMTENLLANALSERFPSTTWRATSTRTSPVQTFTVRD